ncbi:hypothetical protein BH11PSE8_BH11PSE8_10800 [soil metagenome]
MKTNALSLSIAFAVFAASGAAQAADVGQHPAIFSPRSLPAVDPSTFIVGHPAGGYAGKAQATEAEQAAAAAAKVRAESTTTSAATGRAVTSIKVVAPQ